MLLTMEPYLFNFCMRLCAHKVSVECLLYSLSIFFVCVCVCVCVCVGWGCRNWGDIEGQSTMSLSCPSRAATALCHCSLCFRVDKIFFSRVSNDFPWL